MSALGHSQYETPNLNPYTWPSAKVAFLPSNDESRVAETLTMKSYPRAEV